MAESFAPNVKVSKGEKINYYIKEVKKQKILLLFLLPAIISFIFFSYIPMIGNLMAFQAYDPFLGFFKSPFIGLDNFIFIFKMPNFLGALRNTVIISSLKIAIGFPLPIIFALFLNELNNMKFKRTIQTISYLPYFISWVIASGLWYKLLSIDGGAVNTALISTGIIHKPIYFVGENRLFYPLIILTDAWKNLGWSAIIYLASLAGINPELYEASIVDGAGKFKQAVHISLPGMKSTILLLFIFSLSSILNADFDQLYTMGNAAVRDVGEILDTLVLRMLQGGGINDMARGAAMGMFKTVVGFMLFIAANKLSQKLTGESII